MKPKLEPLYVMVSPKLSAALNHCAKELEMSKSQVVRNALKMYIDSMIDQTIDHAVPDIDIRNIDISNINFDE